jgi:Icc-related predicted phosphoesterase
LITRATSTEPNSGGTLVRIAATADLHCGPDREAHLRDVLAGVPQAADLLLLGGDLTNLGEPSEAAALARICRELETPTFAVLGNHDWHSGHHDDLIAALTVGGIQVLEGSATTVKIDSCEVGIVGTKGFIGGFSGHSHVDDFGEPTLRALYREATHDVEALDNGLRQVAPCALRIVLLHYSPTRETLAGEPDGIWAFLGNDRLAAPIVQHEPDLVLHGHAHAGSFTGAIGEVPVRNVSMMVLGAGYTVFELQTHERDSAALH